MTRFSKEASDYSQLALAQVQFEWLQRVHGCLTNYASECKPVEIVSDSRVYHGWLHRVLDYRIELDIPVLESKNELGKSFYTGDLLIISLASITAFRTVSRVEARSLNLLEMPGWTLDPSQETIEKNQRGFEGIQKNSIWKQSA